MIPLTSMTRAPACWGVLAIFGFFDLLRVFPPEVEADLRAQLCQERERWCADIAGRRAFKAAWHQALVLPQQLVG